MYQIKKKVGANTVTQNYSDLEQALGAVALYAERYKEHVNIVMLGSKHRDVWIELEEQEQEQEQEPTPAPEPAQEKPKRGRPKKGA